MDDDDLPPPARRPRDGAANLFGQLFGAGIWLALLFALAAVVLYVVTRAHG